jgi:hypothetical protein
MEIQTMRQLWMITLMGALMALPACAARQSQVDAAPPTVSYEFDDRDDYDEIEQKAEAYCDEHYDREAVLLDEDEEDNAYGDDEYEATFACQ